METAAAPEAGTPTAAELPTGPCSRGGQETEVSCWQARLGKALRKLGLLPILNLMPSRNLAVKSYKNQHVLQTPEAVEGISGGQRLWNPRPFIPCRHRPLNSISLTGLTRQTFFILSLKFQLTWRVPELFQPLAERKNSRLSYR